MVKSPLAGRVKTRLASEVGVVRATSFYRANARAVIVRLAADWRWSTMLAVAPDIDIAAPFWPPNAARFPQGGGDLAARMQRVMDRLPPGPVVIIGTDIPAVRPAHIAAAFDALGSSEAVFGPAGDGGYWLVGQRRMPRPFDAFASVRWSTEFALDDTLANHRGRSVATVAELPDVDNACDLRAVREFAGRVVLPRAGRTQLKAVVGPPHDQAIIAPGSGPARHG
jgi:uncharacterized protein